MGIWSFRFSQLRLRSCSLLDFMGGFWSETTRGCLPGRSEDRMTMMMSTFHREDSTAIRCKMSRETSAAQSDRRKRGARTERCFNELDSGQGKEIAPLRQSTAITPAGSQTQITPEMPLEMESSHSSRHHADLSEQPGIPHAVEVRLTQSGRRQETTTHLVRWGLIACDGNGSFGEQHAS